MNAIFDSIVVTDTRCLGDAPIIDQNGRCTFPGCALPQDKHVHFGAGENLTEQVAVRDYHRTGTGYYRDELLALAELFAAGLARKLGLAEVSRPAEDQAMERLLVDDMAAGLAAAAFAAGYRRVA